MHVTIVHSTTPMS